MLKLSCIFYFENRWRINIGGLDYCIVRPESERETNKFLTCSMIPTSLGTMISLQQYHHHLSLGIATVSVSSSNKPAASASLLTQGNSPLCSINHGHGGRKEKSVCLDSSSSTSSAPVGGGGCKNSSSIGSSQGRRRKCLNLDIRHATTAEQRSMLRGMYNHQQQQDRDQDQDQRRERISPYYPASKMLESEVHGVTSNPTIVGNAISFSGAYYDQYRKVMQEGCGGVEDAYWVLVVADVREACDMFLPIYNESRGDDGYVSVEVAPYLAHDELQTLEATKWLHRKVDRPNVYIRIPSTPDGLPAVTKAVSMGISVNSTLIFSLERYEEVAEAYLRGLEAVQPPASADLSHISAVASFFVSRVDSLVTSKLEELGTHEALSLRGQAASALAALAFEVYQKKFSGPRWEALARRGAKKQRLLWASTSAQNPAYPDTLYVVPLLRADAVNTVPANPQEAFLKHVEAREIEHCQGQGEDRRICTRIQELGVCWADVAQYLEDESIKENQERFESTLTILVKADLEDLFSR
ncbi:hypothetical protein Mapa_012733 [Marchantia paleacea]|nr:hypothetical protein Mapa_012733 [Marchantia paleacea]